MRAAHSAVLLVALTLVAGASSQEETVEEYMCDACRAFNEEMYFKTLDFVDYHKVRIQAGTSQTLKVDTEKMIATMCDKAWGMKYSNPLMMDACKEIVRTEDRAVLEVWSGKDPDANSMFITSNSLCVEQLKMCPPPEKPMDQVASKKRSKCEVCLAVMDDLALEMRWRKPEQGGSWDKKAALWDSVETLCSLMPLRHLPRPSHKANVADLIDRCDRLLDERDEEVVAAFLGLGEFDNPRSICRAVEPKCKKNDEL